MLQAVDISRGLALDVIGDVLLGVRRLLQRPGYRERFFAALDPTILPGTLRAVRAVQRATQEEPSLGDVARILALDASTASRLVEQGVRAGYLTRSTSSSDQRRSVLQLRPEGEELLRRADDARRSLLADLTEQWTTKDVVALADLLERLVEELDEFDST